METNSPGPIHSFSAHDERMMNEEMHNGCMWDTVFVNVVNLKQVMLFRDSVLTQQIGKVLQL
jgi:hypothetical protein